MLGSICLALAAEGEMLARAHRVHWPADGLTIGVYIVRMEAGAFAAVRRIVVIR